LVIVVGLHSLKQRGDPLLHAPALAGLGALKVDAGRVLLCRSLLQGARRADVLRLVFLEEFAEAPVVGIFVDFSGLFEGIEVVDLGLELLKGRSGFLEQVASLPVHQAVEFLAQSLHFALELICLERAVGQHLK
jgi:hypothetical protein